MWLLCSGIQPAGLVETCKQWKQPKSHGRRLCSGEQPLAAGPWFVMRQVSELRFKPFAFQLCVWGLLELQLPRGGGAAVILLTTLS